MVKTGSTMRLIFQDNWNHIIYTEPFTYDSAIEYRMDSIFDAFKTGVMDGLKGVQQDIRDTETIRDIPTHILAQEIKRRQQE